VTSSAVRVDVVSVDAVLPLRHRVLRPGRPESESSYSSDRDPCTVHLAVLDDSGEVLACGTFFPEPLDGKSAWRVRGMATDPRRRGQGLGTAVLHAGIEHVASAGGSLLWCNARLGALALYRRAGFETVGAEFELPGIGAHYLAVLRLPGHPPFDQMNGTAS